MTCPKCGGTKVYFDENMQVERVCTECKSGSFNKSRDLAAVTACIASTPAAGNPSMGLVEVIADP